MGQIKDLMGAWGLSTVGEFESQVEESYAGLEQRKSLAHNELVVVEEAQPNIQDGPLGPEVIKTVACQNIELNGFVGNSVSLEEESGNVDISGDSHGGENPSKPEMLAQNPSISLVVDLTKADCKRRRRRQLSNLEIISEAVESN